MSRLDVVVRLTVGLPLLRAATAFAEGGGPAAGGPADLRPMEAASWQLLRGVCGVVWNAGFLAQSPRRPVAGRHCRTAAAILDFAVFDFLLRAARGTRKTTATQ